MIPIEIVDTIKWSPLAGEILQHFRIKKEISLRRLGAKIGVSGSYILDIEQAKHDCLKIETLQSICQALSLDLRDFFGELSKLD